MYIRYALRSTRMLRNVSKTLYSLQEYRISLVSVVVADYTCHKTVETHVPKRGTITRSRCIAVGGCPP
jgi:hypothetical protein